MSDLETPKVNRGFVAGPSSAVLPVVKINRGFVVRASTGDGGSAARRRAPQVFIRYGDGGN